MNLSERKQLLLRVAKQSERPLSNKELAQSTGLSARSIKKYKGILAKLGLWPYELQKQIRYSDEEIEYIKQLHESGLSYTKICSTVKLKLNKNISKNTIRQFLKHRPKAIPYYVIKTEAMKEYKTRHEPTKYFGKPIEELRG